MVVYVPWLGPRRFHLSLLQIVPFTRFWVTPALRYYFVYSRSTDINNRHGNPRGNGGHHVHVRTRIAKRSLRSLRNLHLIHGFDCCGSHLHTNSHCETDRPRRRFHLCCRRLLPHVLHHNLPPSHARHGLARLGPCHRHSEDVHLLLVCSLVVLRSAWLHQLSILMQYLRIWPQPGFRKLCFIMIGVTIIWTLWAVLSSAIMCIPVSRFWKTDDFFHDPHCLPRLETW